MEPDGGGIMSQRVFGMPMPLVIAGVGLIVYFIFFRNSSSSTQPSTSGGGGTITTGNTTIDKGAVSISVKGGNLPGGSGEGDHGKKKKHHHHKPRHRRGGKNAPVNVQSASVQTASGAEATAVGGNTQPQPPLHHRRITHHVTHQVHHHRGG